MRNTKDPGLGSKFNHPIQRLLNPEGTYNIRRIGAVRQLSDFYTFMLHTSWWQFTSILFLLYIFANLCFALLYLALDPLGIQGIKGTDKEFLNAFFFSCQTFTTVGYGSMHPLTGVSNFIASFEAFIGLMSTALATGLLYGRFSMPQVRIAFSDKILLNTKTEEPNVMFKLVNKRRSVLLRTQLNCILILDADTRENPYFKTYYRLNLEIDQILFFALTWTVVHKITQDSPLYGLTLKDLQSRNAEVIIFLESYDESFGKTVIQKHSYAGDQWAENQKFGANFSSNAEGEIELYIDELNTTQKL